MNDLSLTVVQVLPALEAGGVERGTVEVAAELVRRGHRAIVVSGGGRLETELTGTGAEHMRLAVGRKSPLTLRHVFALRRILERTNADILHPRSRLPAWIARLAWRGMPPERRPHFITSVHGPYSVNAYSRIMVRGERIIAISGFIHKYIMENYPDTEHERIVIIPRGVDPARFPHGYRPPREWLSQWRQQQPQLQGKFIACLPARITRWKGQEDFLKIIARLRDAGIPVHGLAVGGAEHRRQRFLHELQQTVEKSGLQEYITFLGHRGDLREIMSSADVVFSLAREPEAFGRTALEALSLGTPVIGYDHGGAGEVLQEIFPAGRVAPLNVTAAADKAALFYRQPPAVPDNNPFTLQRMLDATLSLYQSTANTG
ncbi:MAG: glycosyltransferase family 4 protein [Gammaproteobacteria bacterium]